MSAGGNKSKLSRGLAIVSTLLTVAVAILWADSYRHRYERPIACGSAVSGNLAINVLSGGDRNDYTAGADHRWPFSGSKWLDARTNKGCLKLAYNNRVRNDSRIQRYSVSRWGFAFAQIRYVVESYAGPEDDSLTLVSYNSRGIAAPLWSLFLLFVIHPACYIIRGPLRKRRRRQRGQCLACGYDISQSPDRCPECGATHKHSRSPRAGDHWRGGSCMRSSRSP